MILVLIIVYAIPAVSLVFFPLSKYIEFGRIHSFFGRLEWLLAFPRDVVLVLFLLIYSVSTVRLYLLVFVGLSFWSYFSRQKRIKQFLDYIIDKPAAEPADFFKIYFASISNLPGHFPQKPLKELALPLDYTNGKQKITILPAIPGIVYTGILARLVVKASRWSGDSFCMKLADLLATMWGATLVKHVCARFSVSGAENLKGLSGRSIFVSDHKSFFDFVIVPLALGLIEKEKPDQFRPRYMAARDHFLDNPFLYRVIGLGRAMEKVGTIFVDRKAKKKRATDSVDDAVRAITEKGVDVAIYPQGTRARGNVGMNGERLDAGYYTTGRPDKLVLPRGHIKKGAAYLAVDAAVGLAGKNISLNIIPIGLKGVGIVAPSKKMMIQKGVDIGVKFGKPLTLTSFDVKDLINKPQDSEEYLRARKAMVEDVNAKIDEMLKETLDINMVLKKKLLIDIRKMMKDEEINRFLEAIDAWGGDQDLIFSTVDCIYSLPPRMWSPSFKRLYHLMSEAETPVERIIDFKRGVVEEMVRGR